MFLTNIAKLDLLIVCVYIYIHNIFLYMHTVRLEKCKGETLHVPVSFGTQNNAMVQRNRSAKDP